MEHSLAHIGQLQGDRACYRGTRKNFCRSLPVFRKNSWLPDRFCSTLLPTSGGSHADLLRS